MQGIVFDIKRFAVHDGPGIRTTVFFKGCPLNCFWCHNPESINNQPFRTVRKVKMDGQVFDQPEEVGIPVTNESIMASLRKDRIFMEESDGGVTFSGGEPTIQPSFLKDLLISCKEEGFHTAVDTCGYTSQQTLEEILPYTDLFLFDLKHVDEIKHQAATGKSNGSILESLQLLMKHRKKTQIRIPVIPGFNFSNEDMQAICNFLIPLKKRIERIDLLPYHTIAQNKYKRFGITYKMEGVKGLNKNDLIQFKEMFEKEGFKVKIGG
jgi:pyruvate formate lyase activating enzyme